MRSPASSGAPIWMNRPICSAPCFQKSPGIKVHFRSKIMCTRRKPFLLILQFPYFILGLLLILWLYRACLPWSLHIPPKKAALSFLKKTGLALVSPSVLVAGVVLGLATSVRVAAPLAGILAVLYAVWKKGKSVLPALVAYAIIAIVVMYSTWPFLWADPIHRFIDSIRNNVEFPVVRTDPVQREYLFLHHLPWFFLPELLGIQFTEPVILLFAVGFLVSIYKLIRKQNFIFALALIWFFLPLAALILTHRPMYDNFRQILFLIPPIFPFGRNRSGCHFSICQKMVAKIIIDSLPGPARHILVLEPPSL